MSSFPTDSVLRRALAQYNKALELRANETKRSQHLNELDQWYNTTLKNTIEGRAELGSHDLIELMKWKLARGKWRPRLEQLVASNSDSLIRSTTSKAISLVSHSSSSSADKSSQPSISNTSEAIKELSKLKGVGPATASAVLALVQPTWLPFMSDELMNALFGKDVKLEYTVKAYEKLVKDVQTKFKSGEGWTANELEKACWARDVLERNGQAEEHDDDKDSATVTKKRNADDASDATTTKRQRRNNKT
ncbi:hypothetical protein ACM66B_003977 [Microbotryomycetes sp. NB124-2]